MQQTANDLAAAWAALDRGDVRAAEGLLRSHLADHDDTEALLQLAQILLLGDDVDEARELLTRAVHDFTVAGLPRRAALAASRLAFVFTAPMANRVAGRPWLARAWRLLEHEGPCLERGWVALAEVGCTVDDPSVLLERADLALTIARQFDDSNLEAKALADGGLALVELGRVGAGMDRLDEAMAQVTSGMIHDHLICGLTVCSFFTACAMVNDFDRMQAWSEVLRRMSIVGDDGIAILTAHCSAVYGHLLWNVGRWGEAETILEDAYQMSRPMNHGGRIHTATALAELRIQQGRLDEAEQLLLGYDDYMESLIPFAHLHLARGDYAMAAGVARRGLRLIGSDRVRKIALLSVLVEASLAAGDKATAEALAGELDDLAAHTELADLPMLAGEARYARARVFGAAGDTGRAIDELDRAVTALGGRDLPLLKSKIHLELARLHSSTDKAAALTEARAAVAIHARFESPFTTGAVGVLEDLGIPLTPPNAAPLQVLLSHRGGAWTLSGGARVFELRATKGLAYVAELIGNPGVERHVFDLGVAPLE